jgi:hypothetical protein
MCHDFFDDFGWEDMALAGSLAEEMTEEQKERMRLEREMQEQDEFCGCNDDDPYL